MLFKISYGREPLYKDNTIILNTDNWDDFGYKTTFHAVYCDNEYICHNLGTVKIAKTDMNNSRRTSDYLYNEFDLLPDGYFSLWQTAEAYKRVSMLERENNCNIFIALKDIAYNISLYDMYKSESVLEKSLFRNISRTLYMRQFRRIARGEAILTPFHFSYIIENNNPFVNECSLDFSVVPEVLPPTNVHAIIGSNGVGKTTLLKHMIDSICSNKNTYGVFEYSDTENTNTGIFENVICVSFNPFDDYSEIEHCANTFKYIGIKKEYEPYDLDAYEDGYAELSLLDDIQNTFIDSLRHCIADCIKKEDLQDIYNMLETSGNFLSSNYWFKLDFNNMTNDNISSAEKFFSQLSAGHKVVISIITRCIDVLVEKTVLFIDEPENHLHPPLLSSLIRGISKILIKRNGVAIISTHSPIVLQEIPRSCVWILNRENNTISARRPDIETFGTNIGVLTSEIFGYEVSMTGFNTLLQQVVDKYHDYESVLAEFDYQLGDEAKSIVRIMLKQKETP